MALQALKTANVADKLHQVHQLARLAETLLIFPDVRLRPLPGLPGQPERPTLVEPQKVPKRSVHSRPGRAALIHAICHIEFNAINLALDAVWRFEGMPQAYYRDWLRVATEEAKHFQWLQAHLKNQLGHDYGDFPAHKGLWEMCEKTEHDIIARMALVPRTLEARGLDATPIIQKKLRATGADDALQACDILDHILRDEIQHVAIGNHWFHWLCQREQIEPLSHYRQLARKYRAPAQRGPFNLQARMQAGFSQQELDRLQQDIPA